MKIPLFVLLNSQVPISLETLFYCKDLKVPKPRCYKKYQPGNQSLPYWRAPSLTDKEDCCLHFLMLYMPTRLDTDRWLEFTHTSSYVELARGFFTDQVLERLIPEILQEAPVESIIVDPGQTEHLPPPQPVQLLFVQEVAIDTLATLPGPYLVTGAAGSGKSTILMGLVDKLRNEDEYEPIVIAPSAVAARHINGQTIHSYFGLFRPQDTASRSAYILDAKTHTMDVVRHRRPFFIIDEVSMLGRDMFEGLSDVCNKVFQDPTEGYRPFGGVPVAMFGDFGQLGPIVRKGDPQAQWLFESPLLGDFTWIRLKTIHRQAQDQEFIKILSIVRNGSQLHQDIQDLDRILKARRIEDIHRIFVRVVDEGATFIACTRAKVSNMNSNCLGRIPSTLFVSTAVDTRVGGRASEWRQDQIERETGLDTELHLKVGARVMITANLDIQNGLLNGAMATILRFEGFIIVVQMDESGAIIRLRRHTQKTLDGRQSRKQFPIPLAYALTVHRVQSLTLNKVIVDLSDTFASGQAYVALSRVRRLADLEIFDFPPQWTDIFPDPIVQQYL